MTTPRVEVIPASRDEAARAGWVWPLLAVLAAAPVLVWPAFWNGYPLLFVDSASYIAEHGLGSQHWARPIFYSLAIYPLHLELSLWPVVLGQGVMVAHLLWLLVRVTAGEVRLPAYALLVGLVAVGSSLPWYVGQVMPDVLTPVVVLTAYLLAFGQDRMSGVERVWVLLLAAGAVACHMSHVPLMGGLLLTVAVLRLLMRRRGMDAGGPLLPALGGIALALWLAVSAHLALNTAQRGTPQLSPSSPIFLLARSIADGPAAATIREHCPEKGWRICAFADRLPTDADEFLWGRDTVFTQVSGQLEDPDAWRAARMNYQVEAQEILDLTFEAHLGWQARAALANVGRQLLRARTGDGLHNWGWGVNTDLAVSQVFPREHAAFAGSRQMTDRLGRETVNRVHGLVLPLAAALAVFLAWRRPDPRYRALLAVVAASLLGSAIITGALSGPHHRYQARVIGLVVVAAGVGLAQLRRGEVAEEMSLGRVRRAAIRS